MDQSKIELLAKLQAKANDPAATDHEREVYLEKVTELMAKWCIDQAMLENAGKVVKEKIVKLYLKPEGALTLSQGMVHLGWAIANEMNGQAFMTTPDRSRLFAKELVVVAFESDAERIKWLWESLQKQALAALDQEIKRIPAWSWMSRNDKDKYRVSYIAGYGNRVQARLRNAVRGVTSSTTGSELVLRSKKSEVSSWVDQNIAAKRGRTVKRDANGSAAGWRDGADASLGEETLKAAGKRHGLGH